MMRSEMELLERIRQKERIINDINLKAKEFEVSQSFVCRYFLIQKR